MRRGSFESEVDRNSRLRNSSSNIECLRRLWLDRTLIDGFYLGPGDAGDFDHGAWHVGCHLVAAGGAMKATDGRLLWLELSHDATLNLYYASVICRTIEGTRMFPLDSADGRGLVKGAAVLGFVEGTSVGRVSARAMIDLPTSFNGWRRQDFDQPIDSGEDGGRVWEHWVTLRDIRPTAAVGTSVVAAYVSLVSVLGDLFAPTVARGRREYSHPEQLVALVRAGFTTTEAAQWDTAPMEVPPDAETLFLTASAADALAAIEKLNWSGGPKYYMFGRRISRWSTRDAVMADFAND